MFDETTILFRPTGPQELALLEASGWKRWPPRLPEQPIFYPVANETYAAEMASGWNVNESGSGFVTRFAVRTPFMQQFDLHTVGAERHSEWWIPADELEELNDNIVGAIQVIAAYGTDAPVNRSIPDSTVMPVVHYRDVRTAVAWLTFVFGCKERLQIADHRSQLLLGGGALVAANSDEPSRSALLVRVPHVDSHHQHAKECGATIVRPPADQPYGERQYTVEDPGGHVWTFSQTIAYSDPAQWGGVLK
jgi:uncharacterized glyoxalase superfamily protein PhnB